MLEWIVKARNDNDWNQHGSCIIRLQTHASTESFRAPCQHTESIDPCIRGIMPEVAKSFSNDPVIVTMRLNWLSVYGQTLSKLAAHLTRLGLNQPTCGKTVSKRRVGASFNGWHGCHGSGHSVIHVSLLPVSEVEDST